MVFFIKKKLMITNQSKICDKTILKTYKSKKETKIVQVKNYENKCDKICEKIIKHVEKINEGR